MIALGLWVVSHWQNHKSRTEFLPLRPTMQPSFQFKTTQEDFLARITEAAYDVVLRQGLQRSFVDVELELWQQIRNVFRNEVLPRDSARRPRKEPKDLIPELSCVEFA